ncbi:MAG: LacI family DNA-binding transcriptional regulator [Myxococcota bacterium]
MTEAPLPPRPRKRSGGPAIGILSNAFGDPYSIPIAQNAAQKLAQSGHHSICFTGGFPKAPFFRSNDGDVSVPDAVDAMILLSATLRGFDEELKRLVDTSQAPVVSIGANLARASSITADDETGVFQAIAHLVKRHDCKRIAFIAGPEGSFDGARRLTAYRIALDSFKLPWDPTLAVRGDYEARSGREAVLELRRNGSRSFDAIVAANDLMAIGAIEGLRAGGIKVPDDVKVVGFDDMEEASFTSPSLTTVRQPIAEQGLCAADVVLRELGGQGLDEVPTHISTPLVIRQSCGCASVSSTENTRRLPKLTGSEAEDRELVGDALRGVVRQKLAQRRIQRELSRIADELLGASGFPELALASTKVLRLLNAQRFLLCVYAANQRQARVALESSGRDVVFRNESQFFPVGQLVPPHFLKAGRPARLWLEPLAIGDEQLGYFIIEADMSDGQSHLELRHYLSSALSRINFTRELRRVYAAERAGRVAGSPGTPSSPPPRVPSSSTPPRK